jgi:hypothetical protein
MLERDEQSLARILEGIDQIEADQAEGGRLDLRGLISGEGEGA